MCNYITENVKEKRRKLPNTACEYNSIQSKLSFLVSV